MNKNGFKIERYYAGDFLIVEAKNNNFVCYNQDIKDKNVFENIFKKYRPQIVIHLAAQAGVRYSIKFPKKYIESNLVGFKIFTEFSI